MGLFKRKVPWFFYRENDYKDLGVGVQDEGFLGDGSLHVLRPDLGTGIVNKRQIMLTPGDMKTPVMLLVSGSYTQAGSLGSAQGVIQNPLVAVGSSNSNEAVDEGA